jgi:ribosomal protein S18 acetylase RimI-like enzyme
MATDVTPIEIDEIRRLISKLGDDDLITDFEEHIQMTPAKESLRVWKDSGKVIAFAYVDGFCNLWFEVDPDFSTDTLDSEIINWGVQIQKQRNLESGETSTLDHSCKAGNHRRMEILARHGFIKQPVKSVYYSRSLNLPIEQAEFSAGYTWRPVTSMDSLASLVDLHRAAFGTENMTVEYRQAIMNAPQYDMSLDFLAVSPDGTLAAFCICSVDEKDPLLGYTDPIGTHPQHQHLGLAKALVLTGLGLLARRGVKRVELGTSSENPAMNLLAQSLGFTCISEKLWFSKNIEL